MTSIKNNLNNLNEDSQSYVKDYIKLVSVKLSEKLALLIGILASIFVLSILLLLVIVFCTFAVATLLNDLLASEFLGYWIVTALYVVIIVFLIVNMIRTKTPMFSNLFAKFIVSILDFDMDQEKDIRGLRQESENVKQKIETDKAKIKSSLQLLRYSLIESFFKELFGLFSSKKKDKETDDEESEEAKNENEKNSN